MLDSTWSYQYPDAVRVGRAIERLGFLWFEDPLNEEDIYAYIMLKQKLDIPILAVWLTQRATDYLRGDIAVRGGGKPARQASEIRDDLQAIQLHATPVCQGAVPRRRHRVRRQNAARWRRSHRQENCARDTCRMRRH